MLRIARFYRGQLVDNLSLWDKFYNQPDTTFHIRNQDKAEPTVLNYLNSNRVCLDTVLYCPCAALYSDYRSYCQNHSLIPLSSWQFKRNMELLGFTWIRCKGFYRGYGKYTITTAFKNVALYT